MKLKRRTDLNTRLRITPLIDVVLLLLIFFLLTSSFVAPSSVNVDLPETKGASPSEKSTVRITISGEGQIYLNKNQVTLDELKTKLSRTKNRKIALYGDQNSSLGTFLDVWETLKQAGVNLFQVRVIPSSRTSPPETDNSNDSK